MCYAIETDNKVVFKLCIFKGLRLSIKGADTYQYMYMMAVMIANAGGINPRKAIAYAGIELSGKRQRSNGIAKPRKFMRKSKKPTIGVLENCIRYGVFR